MARRVARLLGLLALLSLLLPTGGAAQTDRRCFPETGFCIEGRLREFWEQNGGLPVFGYPIAAQAAETIEGKPVQAQWFERNRLELHPENARPYDVLLGRLGVDRLAQQRRDPASFAKSDPRDGCRYAPETGHNICGAFLAAWRASGLEFDGDAAGKSEAENLALFGLPLSDVETETIEGKPYQVQWFERARFELHPENQPPYDVLFGLLGTEVRAGAAPAQPTPAATAVPAAPTPIPTPTTAPAAPAASQYDGAWYGNSSRGSGLSFTVAGGRVTYLEIDIRPKTGCILTAKMDYAALGMTPPRIENNRVVMPYETDKVSGTIEGTFSSDQLIAGTGDFRSVDSGCLGSNRFDWDAKKAPPEPVVANIDGEWRGMTAKAEEIAFTVSGRVITSMTVVIQKKDECTVQITTPQPLTVNSFVLNFTSPVGSGYVNGRFTSSNAASGFLKLVPVVEGCGSGSVDEWRWEARKQG